MYYYNYIYNTLILYQKLYKLIKNKTIAEFKGF